MSTSVVVVSHRPGPGLAACLESVMAQADEVLVVDNGSGGGASRIARSCGAAAVTLRENRGFAGGVNRGLAKATGDTLALLNDDAVASPGWLSSATSHLEDATVAAVGPRVVLAGRYLEIRLDDDSFGAEGDSRRLGRRIVSAAVNGVDVLGDLVGAGVHALEMADAGGGAGEPSRWRWTTGHDAFYAPVAEGGGEIELRLDGEAVRPARVVDLINSAGSYLRRDGYVGDIGADTPDAGHFDQVEERFGISGAAFVTSREMLERVGRFERRYFAYYEDVDWCWRARLMGLRVIYDPSVSIRHERGATSGGMGSRRVRFLSERNRLLTLWRNGPMTLASRQTWRKRRGGGDDGVAEVISRMVPRALAERAVLRRKWALSCEEVFERWAGVEAPAVPA
ncbi:MAG: glycosyltransferase family 2 protein [Acidimicrobiales bacterium]